jgi:CubicO group peptidase (beta-lactamase class C family)
LFGKAASKGKVHLQKGYGFADRAAAIRNSPDTIFEIASLSKQFTAAAVYMLQEKRLLSVDER